MPNILNCYIFGGEKYREAVNLVRNNMASVRLMLNSSRLTEIAPNAYDRESVSYSSSLLLPLLREQIQASADLIIVVSDILIDGSHSSFYNRRNSIAFINPSSFNLASIDTTVIASAIALALLEHRGGIDTYSGILLGYICQTLDTSTTLTPEDASVLNGIQRNREVNCHVILTHGIRTRCHWATEVKTVLKDDFGFDSSVVRHGVIDLFTFALLPSARHKFALNILKECRLVRELNPHVKIAILVHSFSSLLVFRALRIADSLRMELPIDAIITNASILPIETAWSDFFPSEASSRSVVIERVLNICGDRDVWILAADRFISGAGASGLFFYSLDSSRIQNIRLKNCGHSGMLNGETCHNFWGPFLKGAEIKREDISVSPAPWIEALDSYGFILVFLMILLILGLTGSLATACYLLITDHIDFYVKFH